MKLKKKKVAIFTGPEGHLSIAQAAQQALEEQYQVVTFYDKHNAFKIYKPIYQYFPIAHQIPFKLSQYRQTEELFHEIFRQQYEKKIQDFLDKQKPDLCLSTFYMFNSSLEEAGLPFINIVPDPRTIHPLYISAQADVNLVFDRHAVDELQTRHPEASIEESGWFVRSEFEPATKKELIRTQLQLDPQQLTFLVSSGSEGTTMIMKIVPALLTASRPVQVIVACGNNSALRKGIQALREVLKKANPMITLQDLGFITDMHRYLQAADLVIGKAGPNTLFETVATRTPFMAITHISGQEDGNLDIIKEYNLGFVEENPIKAQRLLKEIIAEPDQLAGFAKDIHQLADFNHQAGHTVRSHVDALLS